MFTRCLFIGAALAAAAAQAGTQPPYVKNGVVYMEPGRFGGWPANHGIWIWDNEILVGFSRGYYKNLGPEKHNIDREKPEEHALARSRDGGETWTIEHPNDQGMLLPQGDMLHGKPLPGVKIPEAKTCPGGIDFTQPNFAFTLRMSSTGVGPSRFYTSTDRGHNWAGPYALPLFGQRGVAARTDYCVLGPQSCLLFLTATKLDGKEGRPFCARTDDGGKTWAFQGWMAPEPSGYSIMPATVQVAEREFVTAIRRRDGDPSWLEAYRSTDQGKTWAYLNRPAETGEGNPASLTRLRDGRLCLVYGVRMAPFGMRARLSKDNGATWGEELTLRDDAAGRDIGYPRTVQRPDGKLVTVYYYHDKEKPERYIGCTIWSAPQ